MSIDKINKINTIQGVEEYRKEINEACDKRSEFISVCQKADDLSKGSFLTIKESFEAISPLLFKLDGGKKILNKYAKTIKENKNLSSLHSLCENVRKAGKSSDIDFFINSISNGDWNVNKKTVDEDCLKLGRVLAEGYILVGKEAENYIPVNNAKLSEAIYFLAENKKTNKNIAEFSNAAKVIRDNISEKENESTIKESVNLDELATSLLEDFNKKYSDKLSADEVEALKEVCNSTDKESVFNKYKTSCMDKISEAKKGFETAGNQSAIDRLSTVLEQVSKKTYSSDTLGSDVCSLIELSNIF
jgi:hypothetical protein